MGDAAHLVLDREQGLAGLQVDDVAESVLVLIVFGGDETALDQPPMRA